MNALIIFCEAVVALLWALLVFYTCWKLGIL
jgi:hypothetical protein